GLTAAAAPGSPRPPRSARRAPRRRTLRLRPGPWRAASSREDRLHHAPGDVRQPEIAAVEAVRELRVVKAERAKDRGMQVVDVHLVRDRLGPERVRRPVDRPSLDTPAGEPDREGPGIVVAAGVLIAVAVPRGLAAELAPPE